MKKNVKQNQLYSAAKRQNYYNYYYSMFYNLFMGKYRIDGLDYQQNDYMFRKFFDVGHCAAFNIANTDILGLADFAAVTYNYLDFPHDVTLINNRGANFVPTTPQVVDEQCVIGWAQRNGKPIRVTVELYASKLAAIDMLINIAEKAQKTPWLIGVEPGMDTAVREFMNALDNDEPTLFFKTDEFNLKALVSGAPYIIDKLYNYKQAVMNEILTFLGVNNLGNIEKGERLLTDEIRANNQLVQNCSDNFKTPLEEFVGRINDVLGHDYKLVENTVQMSTPDSAIFGREKGDEDNV